MIERFCTCLGVSDDPMDYDDPVDFFEFLSNEFAS